MHGLFFKLAILITLASIFVPAPTSVSVDGTLHLHTLKWFESPLLKISFIPRHNSASHGSYSTFFNLAMHIQTTLFNSIHHSILHIFYLINQSLASLHFHESHHKPILHILAIYTRQTPRLLPLTQRGGNLISLSPTSNIPELAKYQRAKTQP